MFPRKPSSRMVAITRTRHFRKPLTSQDAIPRVANVGFVLRVGLTGGIGSGKSTVSAALVARGAELIDADQIARQVVEPGMPALAALVDRFGPNLLDNEGRLDRRQLAAIVFSDDAALHYLNATTHPAIAAVVAERMQAFQGSDGIVVLDIPLLDRKSVRSYGIQVVVVVDIPVDVAVARLVAGRGFTEADARARVTAQMSREERRAFADLVVDNAGTPADLEREVDRVWSELSKVAAEAG
jgi:dephospho-CoA kinase